MLIAHTEYLFFIFQIFSSARVPDAASSDQDCRPRMMKSKQQRSRRTRQRRLPGSGRGSGLDRERSGPDWRQITRSEARDRGG